MKSPKQTVRVALDLPDPPEVKVSAEQMADYLDRYAEQLRRVAKQLRARQGHDVVAMPWPPHQVIMNCNGGGDG